MAAGPRAGRTTAPAADRCDRIDVILEVRMKSTPIFLAAGALLACAAVGFAQEKKPSPAAPVAAAQPKPGPEHAILKEQAGAWDATIESFMAAGQPPVLSKGAETGTMVGDFWLVSEFKTDMMGQPFTGHGTMGY